MLPSGRIVSRGFSTEVSDDDVEEAQRAGYMDGEIAVAPSGRLLWNVGKMRYNREEGDSPDDLGEKAQ
jgi:hypothetical protein